MKKVLSFMTMLFFMMSFLGLGSTVNAVGPAFWTEDITSKVDYAFGGGDGTSLATAYEISTPLQLAQLAYNVKKGENYTGKYFIMKSDIDLMGKEWDPIGGIGIFDGYFSGENHLIQNITMTEPSGAFYYGLFGYIGQNATLEKIILNSGSINFSVVAGYNYVGGIVGYSVGFVKDCVNRVNISVLNNDWGYVGGIVGMGNCDINGGNYTSRITGCRNEGEIRGTTVGSVGGIIGAQMNGLAATYIQYCSNTGAIFGGSYSEVGGIAGRVGNAGVLGVSNCYNTGSVTSGDGLTNMVYAGGIIGYEYYTRVENCYNTGAITALFTGTGNVECGGINGHADKATINCYNVGTITGPSSPENVLNGSGIKGINSYYLWEESSEVQYSIVRSDEARTATELRTLTTYNEWDFPEIWSLNPSFNNGFPTLAWQGYDHAPSSDDAEEEEPEVIVPEVVVVPVVITQAPKTYYDLRVTSTEGGSVLGFEGTNAFEAGTLVMLSTSTDEGYTFVGYEGDIDTLDDNVLFMTGNKKINAVFEAIIEEEPVVVEEKEEPVVVEDIEEEVIEVTEEVVPESPGQSSDELLLDEPLPQADPLPQTGGLPMLVFVVFGGTFIGFGIESMRKR